MFFKAFAGYIYLFRFSDQKRYTHNCIEKISKKMGLNELHIINIKYRPQTF